MAVSRWERGVATPTLENLLAVAGALGRPLEWFYESPDEAAAA